MLTKQNFSSKSIILVIKTVVWEHNFRFCWLMTKSQTNSSLWKIQYKAKELVLFHSQYDKGLSDKKEETLD